MMRMKLTCFKTARDASVALLWPLLVSVTMVAAPGCASEDSEERDFFTSGSREADQRAEQRIAKTQQLRGEGQDEDDESAVPAGAGADEADSLYARLGGEEGIQAIVDDFVARALADPRVNWERKGIERGGWNLLKRNQSMEWKPTPQDVEQLKKHMAQFIALSTGGPAQYQGGDIREVHRAMHISNAEFDAAVGDLKASLDKLGIGTDEQKELLSIIESTRPQIVERR